MGNIVKLDIHRKGKDAPEEENKESGSVAWNQLKSKRQPRLKKSDRVIIAENLAEEIIRLGLNALNLAKKIWTCHEDQSRGKYRYLLPKGLSSEKREKRIGNLAADKRSYRRFIEEILKSKPGEDRNLLVDRITYGTSLHPAAGENLSEAEGIFSALQKYVGQLNDRHDLFARYQSLREERDDLVKIQGVFPHYGFLPLLDDNGELQADSWRDIIPYLPHVYLGVADQFDWICAYEDSLYWPRPSTIEYGSKSLGNRERRAHLSEESDILLEMEKLGAKDVLELWKKKMEHYQDLEEQAKWQPKDPEWSHWHQAFIDAIQKCHPITPRIFWDASGTPKPKLEDGSTLSSINLILRKARRTYLRKLAVDLNEHGTIIPEEVFAGNLWDADEHRPLMELVKLECDLMKKPFPPQAKRLYETDKETKQIFDDYSNAAPSPVWLTVCLSHDGKALVPTLVYRHMEWSAGEDGYIFYYAIDSPRALLEMHRYSEISIAWPSPEPCIKRIRELICNDTIEQEWQRTADFLKYHPLSKRYEQNKKIRELLEKVNQPSSQEKSDEY